MATVIIPSTLRSFSGGRDRVVVGGRTLRQVFDQLEVECPGIKGQLLEDDDIRPGLAIVVDNEVTSEGLITVVEEDTEVHILPAIGGGSLHDGSWLPLQQRARLVSTRPSRASGTSPSGRRDGSSDPSANAPSAHPARAIRQTFR